MKIETVKSYILFILVLISLLLTFFLWNYKPNYSTIKGDTNYLNEIDLGGSEQTKRSIIHPSNIVFHKNKDLYGFDSPNNGQVFYKQMQAWSLDDFQVSEHRGMGQNTNYIEVVFPSKMPTEVIRSLFKISENEYFPDWSFKHMYITFNQQNSTLDVQFVSIDNHQEISFKVKDSSVFKYAWSHIQSKRSQVEYFQFGATDSHIYLPKSSIEMKSRLMSVNSINVNLLVDALFVDPSLVNPNSAEGYLSDGQRRIKLLEDRRSMEFAHPMHSKNDKSNTIDLLDRSLANINRHKGWTDTFFLEDIDTTENLLRYRMKYDGYPVFNKSDLSIIEQELINLDLRAYRRPLFKLVNPLDSKDVTLISGTEVDFFLSNNEIFKKEYIENIQVGYKLTYFDRISHTLSLDPAWYIKYNGVWIELRVDQFEDSIIGGD